MNADQIILDIIKKEGGFVNHAADKGGPTKFGITLNTLASWRRSQVIIADVANLTEEEAKLIYKKRFIVDPGLDKIKDGELAGQAVDCFVLHGSQKVGAKAVPRPVIWLQEIAGVPVDGFLGPKTLAALGAIPAPLVGIELATKRINFIGKVINNNAKLRKQGKVSQSLDQGLFAEGWLARATSFLDSERDRLSRMLKGVV